MGAKAAPCARSQPSDAVLNVKTQSFNAKAKAFIANAQTFLANAQAVRGYASHVQTLCVRRRSLRARMH